MSRCDTEQSCSEAVIFSLSKSELQDAVEGSRLEETDRQIDNVRTRVTRHRLSLGSPYWLPPPRVRLRVVVPVTAGRMRIVEGGKEVFSDLSSGCRVFPSGRCRAHVFNGGDQDLVSLRSSSLAERSGRL